MRVLAVLSGEHDTLLVATANRLNYCFFLCTTSCLDDDELALLGVPWDSYSSVAVDIGLDLIR